MIIARFNCSVIEKKKQNICMSLYTTVNIILYLRFAKYSIGINYYKYIEQ